MRTPIWLVLVPLAVLAAACGQKSAPAVDDALKNDLALASQAQAFNPQQTVSPTEAGYAPQAAPRTLSSPRATAPVRQRSSTRRSTSGTSRNSTSSGNGGGYYPSQAPAPAPPPEVEVKHTERDAAIGAVGGAVIGAMSSRNKVRGGIIGAAAGGILGAVIGNNVDKSKKAGW